MKAFSLFMTALCLGGLVVDAQTTPVQFPVNSLFGGAAYNKPITITAVNTLITDGQNIWAGSYTILPASTNTITKQLYPNDYMMTVPGVVKPARFSIYASDGTNIVNVNSRLTSGPLFYFGTNGFASLVASNNIAFTTNSDGSISISSTPLAAGTGTTVTQSGGTNIVSIDTNIVVLVTNVVQILASQVVTNGSDATLSSVIATNISVFEDDINVAGSVNVGTGTNVTAISQNGSTSFAGAKSRISEVDGGFTGPVTATGGNVVTNNQSSLTAGQFYGGGGHLTGLPDGIKTNAIVAFTNVSLYGMVQFQVANGIAYYYPIYTNSAPSYFTLTVSNGIGGGSYQAGALVGINTNNVIFTNWSQQMAGLVINTNAASTALIMPNSNVWVSANYFSPGGSTTYSNMVASYTPTATRNDFSWSLGAIFKPTNNMTVYALSRYVVSGNAGTHTVHLTTYPQNNDVGTVSVNTAGQPVGMKYVTLSSPIHLTNGYAYFLASDETVGGDIWNDAAAGNTSLNIGFWDTADGNYLIGSYASGGAGNGSGISNNNSTTNSMYVGVDLQFTIP